MFQIHVSSSIGPPAQVIENFDPGFALTNQFAKLLFLDRPVIVPGVSWIGEKSDQIFLARSTD
jgi:hypothetical protein